MDQINSYGQSHPFTLDPSRKMSLKSPSASSSSLPSPSIPLHVTHVLTAEFDIDSGPTLKLQYPSSVEGDKQYVFI